MRKKMFRAGINEVNIFYETFYLITFQLIFKLSIIYASGCLISLSALHTAFTTNPRFFIYLECFLNKLITASLYI